MQRDFLNIGEVKVFDDPVELTCYGLGSCVCVFIYDSFNKVGGGAHIALPKAPQGIKVNSTEYADQAMQVLLREIRTLEKHGPGNLRAKLIGGANVLAQNGFDIGKENTEVVKKLLIDQKVFIAGIDLGGERSRTGRFHTHTGKLLVSSQTSNYEI